MQFFTFFFVYLMTFIWIAFAWAADHSSYYHCISHSPDVTYELWNIDSTRWDAWNIATDEWEVY